MQGMSMGNMMTGLFARNFGNVLAGAAGSGAAAFLSLVFDKNEKIINTGGPLAIWQSRPERNDIPPNRELEKKVHKYNRLYWMRINDCCLLYTSIVISFSVMNGVHCNFYGIRWG